MLQANTYLSHSNRIKQPKTPTQTSLPKKAHPLSENKGTTAGNLTADPLNKGSARKTHSLRATLLAEVTTSGPLAMDSAKNHFEQERNE